MTLHTPKTRGEQAAAVMVAAQVLPITRAESAALATAGLERFVRLLEQLNPDEWLLPTLCTEWTVRDMVAHQAGAYEGGASLLALLRQFARKPPPGRDLIDAVNAYQIGQRHGRTPAELIAELRSVGPRAIASRRRMPSIMRTLPVPIPPLGLCRLGYLLDEIYLRDTWIHTVDIWLATNRRPELTAAHDGRIVALVVRDLAARLAGELGGRTVHFDLTGPAGGRYAIGPAPAAPDATITLDAVDFNLLASTRVTPEATLARCQIAGDEAIARHALARTLVVY